MRLPSLALIATVLFIAASTVDALSGVGINIATESVLEQCRPTMELAEKQSHWAYEWFTNHYCRSHTLPFRLVKNDIDPVVKRVLKWTWKRLDPPLSLENEVLPFYEQIKKECILDPQWGVVNHPDFCLIKSGDRKLSNMVNGCILPRVVNRYMPRLPELEGWAKTTCAKGETEAAVKGFLVNTESENFLYFRRLYLTNGTRSINSF